LGTNGRVIIEVIPEVELIMGSQPPIPQLESGESQNRFYLVFQKFLGVFTSKKHPLVLFIDDLQWVDSASLKLLQLLMMSLDSQYFLLIGAYPYGGYSESLGQAADAGWQQRRCCSRCSAGYGRHAYRD
jgi:predicted ATPase